METVGVDTTPIATATARRAESVAVHQLADAESRADSIAFLALSSIPLQPRRVFEQLLTAAEPEAVHIAAARALGRIPGEETGHYLLKGWRTYTSNVRMEAADALYRDPNRIPMVVAAQTAGFSLGRLRSAISVNSSCTGTRRFETAAARSWKALRANERRS